LDFGFPIEDSAAVAQFEFQISHFKFEIDFDEAGSG